MHTTSQIVDADRGRADPVSLGAALIAGKKVAPDVTLLLAQDHVEALGYFDWAESATGRARSAVVQKLCAALIAHMRAEEEILYPAARAAFSGADDEVVERAYDEHEEAREIVDQLMARKAPKGGVAAALKKLREAIQEHVDEEERNLFPKLRATDLDLHALGRQAAARRAELLLELTGRVDADTPLRETNMTAIASQEAHSLFVAGLRDEHAAARQCREMTQRQVERLENYPDLRERMRRHLAEKDAQLARIERILESLGESRSVLKDTAMAISGNIASMMTMPAGDEVLKNGLMSFGLANFEAASLEALLVMGEAAGHTEAIRELQQSLNEERAIAAWLAENQRGVLLMHLQRRTNGEHASR